MNKRHLIEAGLILVLGSIMIGILYTHAGGAKLFTETVFGWLPIAFALMVGSSLLESLPRFNNN